MSWKKGISVVGALAVAAILVGLAVASSWTPGSETVAPDSDEVSDLAALEERSSAHGPLDVRRFKGSLETTIGEPMTGYVVVGPTSDNNLEFDAGSKGSYAVAEVAWDTGDVQELGAVLFVYRGTSKEYGHVNVTIDQEWEPVTDVTGPAPLYLATPIEPDTRYSWMVYALPGEVIVHLDFESAMSVFETVPPADYRVFSAEG